MVGLLAGEPGSGKTLTAEAVAEVTHKPLYVVSAGELGVTPTDVELRLLRALEIAQMWDAVLLLDEAEVFLQQRGTVDIVRNALVAIFLRQLEYYRGIMILTTNMAEQCDRAFESKLFCFVIESLIFKSLPLFAGRIHFSVHYPGLDLDARKKIWQMFFAKASTEIGEADLDILAGYTINGRQVCDVNISQS